MAQVFLIARRWSLATAYNRPIRSLLLSTLRINGESSRGLMDFSNPFFGAWTKATFSDGAIPSAKLEAANFELLLGIYLPTAIAELEGNSRYAVLSPRPEQWFEGTAAYARYLARESATPLEGEKSGQTNINFRTWALRFFTNLRTLFGPSFRFQNAFPASVWEDPEFLEAWAKSARVQNMDANHAARFFTGVSWDVYPIPLRYFTDSAATEVLNADLSASEINRTFSQGTYIKDIRGKRSGLGLKPHPCVVSWAFSKPDVLCISASAARKQGLALERLERTLTIGSRSFDLRIED